MQAFVGTAEQLHIGVGGREYFAKSPRQGTDIQPSEYPGGIRKQIRSESDVLVPQGERGESPAQFGGGAAHVETNHSLTEHAAGRVASSHALEVGALPHECHVGKHVKRCLRAEGAFVVEPVGKGEYIVGNQGQIMPPGEGIAVEWRLAEGSEQHMSLSPNSP